jgi:S1-C subfamily serine protease
MGQRAWATSEPPLTIGRGLTAATGAIGALLALAVLWTMVPTHAGRSAGVSVRSTLAIADGQTPSSAASLLGSSTTTRPSTTASASTTAVPATSTPTTTPTTVPATANTQAAIGPTTASMEPTPLPTYAVEHQDSVTVLLGAVAVAVNNGSLVITTAGAVDTGDVISLRLPDGGIEQARVLLVDQRTGLAVLAHDTPSVASFTVASAVQPGDVLRFYGADQVTAVVQADGSVDTSALDASNARNGLPEGTPVVNQRGELVALCSHNAAGPLLVSLAGLDELRRVLAAEAVDKVWVGVMLGSDPSAGVVVDTLDPGGPAADAGVQAGDRILSVDGVDVVDAATLGGVLAAHSPGDTVTLVVARHGDQRISIAVVLGSPRSSL